MAFWDSIPGAKGVFGSFDFGKLLTGTSRFITILLILVAVSIVIGLFLYAKTQKKIYNKKIFWFEEVHGAMIPLGTGPDLACELTVPQTNVRLFYIKSKKLYLPRGTKRMGKDSYWYAIRNNREIVNFTMKNINEEMKEANLDFDHTDMRYGAENLLAIIKRNYKDGNRKWWQEYKDLISTVIFIVVMSISFWFLIKKINSLMGTAEQILEQVKAICQASANSGVAKA